MELTSPLTQVTYRLWARIGGSFNSTPGSVLVTNSTASVVAQLAALAALSVTMEQY